MEKGNFVHWAPLILHANDKRLGVIVKTERDGGVFRGHCDVWFGEIDSSGTPVTKMVLESNLTLVNTPISAGIKMHRGKIRILCRQDFELELSGLTVEDVGSLLWDIVGMSHAEAWLDHQFYINGIEIKNPQQVVLQTGDTLELVRESGRC